MDEPPANALRNKKDSSMRVAIDMVKAGEADCCVSAGNTGALMAVGPGWLRTKSERSPPAQARWQQWLRMRPDGEGHVVSISGNAEVAVEGRGRLSGAEMHHWPDVVPEAAAARRPASRRRHQLETHAHIGFTPRGELPKRPTGTAS